MQLKWKFRLFEVIFRDGKELIHAQTFERLNLTAVGCSCKQIYLLADDDTYSTTHSCSSHGSNSLSKALAALKESKPPLNLTSPCKGVLIIGVGFWSEDAPISKQRFLKDCAQVFDLLPLEYFELTCDNVHEMSDIILRRFFTFHQQAALEDLQAGLLSGAQMAPKSRCILS